MFDVENYNRYNTRIIVRRASTGDAEITGAISELLETDLGSNRALISDISGKIVVSVVTATELSYLSGATSNLQDQIDALQPTVTPGDLTEVTSSVLTITGGTDALLDDVTIQVKLAGAAQSGYLSTTDWNTFNNKQSTSLTSGYIRVGNGSSIATAVDTTSVGDILAHSTNGLTIKSGVIVDADINASAAITRTKVASGTAYRVLVNNVSGVFSEQSAITASRALISDANGLPTHSTITSTQLGYLSGATSNLQDQITQTLGGQALNALVITPTATEDGFAITWDDGAQEYTLTDPVVQGIPTGGSSGWALIKQSGTDFDSDWESLTLAHIGDVTALVDDVNILAGADSAGVTATDIGYLVGIDSNLQDQLDAKQSSSLAQNAIWIGNSSGIATQLSPGTDGYVLTSVGGVPQWQPSSGGVSDGDYGDVVLSGGATAWTVDATLNKSWTGTHTFLDNSFTLLDNSDNTKVLAFQLSGITTATTRTLTIPDLSGTIVVNPMTTGGDLIYGGASGVPTRLANGSAGQVLTSAGGTSAPTWTTIGGISGLTTNRIPYATSATTLGDDSALTWDATNNGLTVNGVLIHGATTNVFIGNSAVNYTYSGTKNITIGASSTTSLSSGIENVVVGYGSGNSLTNAAYNIAIGSGSLISNTSSAGNIAIGATTLTSATGAQNIAIGHITAQNITSGASNIIMGAGVNAQSATANYQLSIQNAIFGLSNSGTGTTVSAGFVGIYQPNPTYQLHVTGHSANQNLFLVEENGGANAYEIIESAGALQIGWFGATPIPRPTTAHGAATFVANTSLIANDSATFDGYTLGQIVKALRDFGLLT